MPKINEVEFVDSMGDILTELQNQLKANDIPYLHTIRYSSGNYMVPCPYHKNGLERKPSAGIKETDGTFHCFACGETHTLPEVISFVFGHNDMTGGYGWSWLLKNFLSIEVEKRPDIQLDFSRGKKKDTEKKIEYVSEEELDSYRYTHPYWAERGIVDDNIIELFDLGYDKNTKSIVFPNYNENGDCLYVARRSVRTKFFSYPKNTKKIVYGIYQLYKQDKFPNEVWITESMIDCLRLWQIGKYACALNGLGNEMQFQQLEKMPCREFVLATDNDDAGNAARLRLRHRIHNKIFSEVNIPNGHKDIGECTDDELKLLTPYLI